MKTLKIGDTLEFAEHDGIYKKKIVNIIWKEGGKLNTGKNELREKDEILLPAVEWSLLLFDDNTYAYGNELPTSILSNHFKN
jgi:hypothetical protein